MSIELTTLPSGLRVMTDHVSAVDSVALGVWADAGTRHEDLAHNGAAHMIEHMLFKGTQRRSAARIAEEIEDVGGQMNAWTSREMTSYHVHLLKEDTELALDILSDMLQHSKFEEEDVERERGVIVQEIGMTFDTPDDIIFDHYQKTAYPGQALGAPILGTAAIVENIPRETLLHYVRAFYTPQRLVVSAAGNVKHENFVRSVERFFDALPQGNGAGETKAVYGGGEIRVDKTLEQSHIVLGFQGVPRGDRLHYPAVALSIILGGGMSSRLFQEIREKRGLVYTISGFHAAYQDDGQFAVYAGTGPDDLTEMMPVLCAEIEKVCSTVTEEELARAKAQIRAGIVMGRESMMSRANQQAKHLIHSGTVLDVKKKLQKIAAITVEDIHEAARRILATRPTLAALGPLKNLESYEAMAARFSSTVNQ